MSPTVGRSNLALTGFIVGALFAGIALTVHVLLSADVMLRRAGDNWWGTVVDAMVVGGVAGLAGAALGWWLGSRPCPFPHTELPSQSFADQSEGP